jgi:hypothetical protein
LEYLHIKNNHFTETSEGGKGKALMEAKSLKLRNTVHSTLLLELS